MKDDHPGLGVSALHVYSLGLLLYFLLFFEDELVGFHGQLNLIDLDLYLLRVAVVHMVELGVVAEVVVKMQDVLDYLLAHI